MVFLDEPVQELNGRKILPLLIRWVKVYFKYLDQSDYILKEISLEVQLKTEIEQMPLKYSTQISGFGDNLSGVKHSE